MVATPQNNHCFVNFKPTVVYVVFRFMIQIFDGPTIRKHRFKTRSPAMSLTGPAKAFPDSQIIKMTMELTYSIL